MENHDKIEKICGRDFADLRAFDFLTLLKTE
jgi:hypothetical protein